MIRRHARSLQALLVAADALLAAALLVVLSYLRFGAADWAIYWRQAVRGPLVFVALYAVGWVAVLWLHGLYRPRARWSISAEVGDIVRATIVMAFASFSVLFIFKLPDVSRLFLLLLFPAQAVLALGTRAALRIGFERLRRRGLNARFVLVVGDGPEAARLRAMAGPSVRFLGHVDRTRLLELFGRCHAYLVPGIEDFGIAPVEAMAAGKPVVAFRAGGATETVVEGTTGLFFDEPSAEALSRAIADVDRIAFDLALIRARAEQFDVSVFRERFTALLLGLGVEVPAPPQA